MSISNYPSVVVLKDRNTPYPDIIDFLDERFPKMDRAIWKQRIADGKMYDEKGVPVTFDTRYVPGKKLYYFREVENETKVPFNEKILFINDEFMVACKPHFLPVIPVGNYVNECLLNRLKNKTGNKHLTPVNRIDRDTAGIVLFSCNPKTRGTYHDLFNNGKIDKTYEAITECLVTPDNVEWIIENRLVPGAPWFRMKIEPGIVNSKTHIRFIKSKNNRAIFQLNPITGKKHQLRIHLSTSGYGILNDGFYPQLLAEKKPDFNNPLQLLAKSISFKDPISGKSMEFVSDRILSKSW